MPEPRSPDFYEAIRALNGLGWTDTRISRAFGRTVKMIALHRSKLGLAPAPSKFRSKIDTPAGLEMWDAGASDNDLAKFFGSTQSAATQWRHRMRLKRNFEPIARTDERKVREAQKLLKLGASRDHVASKLYLSVTTITKIRKGMGPAGLRKTGHTNRVMRARALNDTSLLDRITEAIGRGLPQDVRQDAVDELYLAVLSGEVTADRIAELAPRYRSAAYSMNYGDYARVSLTEDRDGWCLQDNLEDPDALDRMEEFANDD